MMRAMTTPTNRLDRRMNERRLQLGIRWKEVADDADITYQTLGQLRKGRPVSDLTISNVERALHWEPGSIRTIQEGGAPSPLEPDPPEGTASAWDGVLEGPTTPLRDEEVLRWRTGETGRRYRLEIPDEDVNVEYTFSATEAPEEVIEDLRDLLEPHRAAVRQLERRRARR